MQLHRAEQQLTATGATLAVIGNGAPNFIAGFRDKTGFAGKIYTDPSRQAYRALRLRRDPRATLNLKVVARAIRAYAAGSRQSRVQGDPWQQGGVCVVARSGEIVYRYAAAYAGDHPSIAALVRALP